MKKNRYNKRGWLEKTIPFFILGVFVVLFFNDTLFGNKIFIHRDLSRFFYPLREFSVTQFLNNKIPLWNPYIHCGTPHLAKLQTCVFYPLSAIYLLFSYPLSFNYFIIFHVFLAGVFTYLLMREWNYSKHASFFSAMVFMFSGYMISVINLIASLASVIWLPLVILFYERSLKRDWIKNSIICSIFLSLMLLGGEPIILYATFFILLLLYPISKKDLLEFRNKPSFNLIKRPLILIIVFLASLIFSAFQLLPFIEFLKYSSRVDMNFNEASMWSLPFYALLDLFIPYLSESDYLYKDYWTRQSWLLVYYMGIFTLICTLISLKFDLTKRRRRLFYILSLGLVLSFGRYTPVYYFFYNFIPVFSLSRYPIKFFFMVAFSISILAGIGLDYYRKNVFKDEVFGRFLKRALVLGFVLSLLYLVLNLNFVSINKFFSNKVLSILPGFIDKKDNLIQFILVALYNLKRAIGIFMALSLLMFFGFKNKIRLNFLIAILLSISFLDIFTANKNVYMNMDINEYLKPSETAEFLMEDKSLFRIFDSPATLRQNTFVPERDYFEGMHALKERMASNRGISYGIYDAYGYGSLYNRRHEELVIAIVRTDSPDETNLLNLLNVKYIISPTELKIKGYTVVKKELEAEGYKLVKKTKKVNIYENKNVLARAFLVKKTIFIKDEEKIVERLKSKDFNPSEEVILEEKIPFLNNTDMYYEGEEKVEILSYKPNEVIIKVAVKDSNFLVLSDSFYPDWKVYVDGKKDKIYRGDYILRTVYLKPGKHIVRFTYKPFSFKIGSIITIGSLLIAIYLLWKRRLL